MAEKKLFKVLILLDNNPQQMVVQCANPAFLGLGLPSFPFLRGPRFGTRPIWERQNTVVSIGWDKSHFQAKYAFQSPQEYLVEVECVALPKKELINTSLFLYKYPNDAEPSNQKWDKGVRVAMAPPRLLLSERSSFIQL